MADMTAPVPTTRDIAHRDYIVEIHQAILTDSEMHSTHVLVSFPEGAKPEDGCLVWCRNDPNSIVNFPVKDTYTFLQGSMNNIRITAPKYRARLDGQVEVIPGPDSRSLLARFHASRETLILLEFQDYHERAKEQLEPWLSVDPDWCVKMRFFMKAHADLSPYKAPQATEAQSSESQAQPDQVNPAE